MEPSDRVLLIAVDDSEDSKTAFRWALDNVYREGDCLHLVHVVPRLAFAAQYGVPPVDFVPVADNNGYESAVQRAEQFIIDRFVRALPADIKAPVVHIIKVRSEQETRSTVLSMLSTVSSTFSTSSRAVPAVVGFPNAQQQLKFAQAAAVCQRSQVLAEWCDAHLQLSGYHCHTVQLELPIATAMSATGSSYLCPVGLVPASKLTVLQSFSQSCLACLICSLRSTQRVLVTCCVRRLMSWMQ